MKDDLGIGSRRSAEESQVFCSRLYLLSLPAYIYTCGDILSLLPGLANFNFSLQLAHTYITYTTDRAIL